MKIEDIIAQVLQTPNSAFFYTPPIFKKSYSYLFLNPKEKIIINNVKDLSRLNLIDKYLNKNLTGYTLIKYETGYLFEKKLNKLLNKNEKNLLQFYFFDKNNFKKIKSEKIIIGEIEKDYEIKKFKLNTSKKKFAQDIKSIKNYIAKGDTYQVNYTVKGLFDFSGSVINLFKNLIFNQSAQYSAIINNGEELIISLSPELFFHLEKSKIYSMPMKGTRQRGIALAEDLMQSYSLKISEKDKAENLMIVDLLRNDIGKVSEFDKVKTKNLFSIETYETLHQMVSTIEGKLKSKIKFGEIIKSLFPCGSITGAPKIRTMELIHQLEKEKRGIYTGAIGLLSKEKSILNVAIRTIKLNKKNMKGEVGIGSGIVWDSKPESEYKETLLKSNFLLKPSPYFELFETMKLENGKIFLLQDHLERLKDASKFFLFNFNEKKILNALKKSIEKTEEDHVYRLKLILNKWGKIKIETKEFHHLKAEAKIIISEKVVSSENKFQYFKTTNRKLYDDEFAKYSKAGFNDVIFLNEKNEITEGAISNIFILKDDNWFTPPISSGILNGVYRKHLLQNKRDILQRDVFPKEEEIYLHDLLNCDQIILTNSLRCETKIKKLYITETEFKEF